MTRRRLSKSAKRSVYDGSTHTRTLTLSPPLLQEFACNGTVVDHPEYGEVIQLQGDQRLNISEFLMKVGLAKKEQIKMHGF